MYGYSSAIKEKIFSLQDLWLFGRLLNTGFDVVFTSKWLLLIHLQVFHKIVFFNLVFFRR